MKTSFITPTCIDPKCWSMIGVTAKPNTDNPIGHFGTGMKYAIAIALRKRWKISITNYVNRVPTKYVFSCDQDEFRGQEIEVVKCNDSVLPFTTHYGAHWADWTVFRELYSNTIDEGGSMEIHTGDIELMNGSVFTVESDEFAEIAQNKEEYFLEDGKYNIFLESQGIEVLNEKKYSGKIFFKGIYVGSIKEARYGYAFNKKVSLTEDRTFASQWSVEYDIGVAICSCEPSENLKEYLLSGGSDNRTLENNMPVPSYISWNSDFVHFVAELNKQHPHSLLKCISFNIPSSEKEYEEVMVDGINKKMLDSSLALLKKCGFDTSAKIKMVEVKDGPLIAFVQKGVIHLTAKAFKNEDYLTSTLIEEIAHTLGYSDESREYEQYLCDTMVRLMRAI